METFSSLSILLCERCKKLLIVLPLLVVFTILGCAAFTEYGKLESNARKSYQKGYYDGAVFDCVRSLKVNPNYDKAQQLIRDAFNAGVNSHKDNIKQFTASSEKFKWDKIVPELEALIKMNDAVRSLPTLTVEKTKEVIKFDIVDYTDELQKAKTNTAESHYQEGVRLAVKSDDVDTQKQAAKEFKTAESFVAGYKDATEQYERTKKAGIKRMAIIPFEDKTGKGGKYGAISEVLVDKIISNVMNDPSSMEFLEIISRDQLERVMREQQLGMTGVIDEQTAAQLGKILGVHEILSGKITQIIYTPERTTSKTVQEKASVVIGEEQYTDNKGKRKKRDVWGDVLANISVYNRTTNAAINGSYQIIDIKTAKIKKSESFAGKSNFVGEWAKFSGDERATGSYSELLKKGEQLAPVEEEIVSSAVDDLATSLASTLKTYVR